MFTPARYPIAMSGQPFITKPLSLWLDLIRAAAALMVVVGHAYEIGLYTGPYPFTIALQLNAVVVFFVLSGLVIASSAAGEGQSLARYSAARLARILSVALPALAISYGAAVFCAAHGFSPKPVSMDPGLISPTRTLLAALFLSESVTSGLAINPPYWSLACEVWFYALFGIAMFLRGWQRAIWLVIACAVAGANVLLLLPAWLAGVWLTRAHSPEISPSQARMRVIVVLTALMLAGPIAPMCEGLLRSMALWNLGHSHYALSYALLAAAFAYGLTGLRALLGESNTLLEAFARPIKGIANMSFSLYLLHWPLLTLLRADGVSAGTNPLAFLALIAGVVAVSSLFAALTEHRRKPMRMALERLFSTQSSVATPA